MKFNCTIKMDNAAFDNEPGNELALILRIIAGKAEEGYIEGPVRDTNGNKVGKWEVK